MIEKRTSLSYGEVVSILLDSEIFELTSYSEENIIEQRREGNFRLEIKPPPFMMDASSRVIGHINSREGLTVIRLKIRLNRIIIGFIVFWNVLLALMIFTFDYENILETIQFVGVSIIWISIPFVVGWLKVYCDSKKLEKWMLLKIKTLPDS